MIRIDCDCIVSGKEVWKGYRCASHVTIVFVKTTILSGGYRGGGGKGGSMESPFEPVSRAAICGKIAATLTDKTDL